MEQWPQPDTPAPVDELLGGPWIYHVLQMANRYYRPSVLRYHRAVGDDNRLKYITYFLDVRDQRVLEIGPLEGHHSVILEKMGVRENIAIEGRAENLKKCLRVKEKYHLDHTQFLQYNLESLYKEELVPAFAGPFDLVFCLGVLYFMPDPGRALAWMRSQSNTLFLGTSYIAEEPRQAECYSYGGKAYRGLVIRSGDDSDGDTPGTAHGMSPTATVLCEKDLLLLMRDVGYSRISVLGKDMQGTSPHITILAEA